MGDVTGEAWTITSVTCAIGDVQSRIVIERGDRKITLVGYEVEDWMLDVPAPCTILPWDEFDKVRIRPPDYLTGMIGRPVTGMTGSGVPREDAPQVEAELVEERAVTRREVCDVFVVPPWLVTDEPAGRIERARWHLRRLRRRLGLLR